MFAPKKQNDFGNFWKVYFPYKRLPRGAHEFFQLSWAKNIEHSHWSDNINQFLKLIFSADKP